MEQHLIIDWEKIHLYNSFMSVMTGVGVLSIWSLFSKLINQKEIRPKGIALNFGVIGIILFITGVHTTLTWPLTPTFPFDNSAFGEPSLLFGCLLLVMAFYFWKDKEHIAQESLVKGNSLLNNIVSDFNAFKFVLAGMGLATIMIGLAGIKYKIFIAPPEEPIVGPLEEMIPFISSYTIGLLWTAVGIAAIGFGFYSESVIKQKQKSFKWLFYLLLFIGISFFSLGVVTYFSHVGMEINTMDPSTIKPHVIMNPDPHFQPVN